MKIYGMLIRSKIDYGAVIYNSASKTTLNNMSVVANDVLRIATGPFKSTPIASLEIITNERPLQLRRDAIILKYYYKRESLLNNSAFNDVVNTSHHNLFKNKRLAVPLSLRALELTQELNIGQVFIKPTFSYRISRISTLT